jgi:hypothetical protein
VRSTLCDPVSPVVKVFLKLHIPPLSAGCSLDLKIENKDIDSMLE